MPKKTHFFHEKKVVRDPPPHQPRTEQKQDRHTTYSLIAGDDIFYDRRLISSNHLPSVTALPSGLLVCERIERLISPFLT